MNYKVGQVLRVFARKNGAQLWDAVVVRVCQSWIGLRPKPLVEESEGGNMFTTNFNLDSYELFPMNSPVFRFVEHEQP